MKTKAVRLYGQEDIRLEEFELPPIKEDEILAEVVTDSLCMSSYKAAIQGEKHKKVPEDINENPIILGHEFCGVILSVGEKWKISFRRVTSLSSSRTSGRKMVLLRGIPILMQGETPQRSC